MYMIPSTGEDGALKRIVKQNRVSLKGTASQASQKSEMDTGLCYSNNVRDTPRARAPSSAVESHARHGFAAACGARCVREPRAPIYEPRLPIWGLHVRCQFVCLTPHFGRVCPHRGEHAQDMQRSFIVVFTNVVLDAVHGVVSSLALIHLVGGYIW